PGLDDQVDHLRVRHPPRRRGLVADQHPLLHLRHPLRDLRCRGGLPRPLGSGFPHVGRDDFLGNDGLHRRPALRSPLCMAARGIAMEVKHKPAPVSVEIQPTPRMELRTRPVVAGRPALRDYENAYSALGPNVITTTTDQIFGWARKNSLWPVTFGL